MPLISAPPRQCFAAVHTTSSYRQLIKTEIPRAQSKDVSLPDLVGSRIAVFISLRRMLLRVPWRYMFLSCLFKLLMHQNPKVILKRAAVHLIYSLIYPSGMRAAQPTSDCCPSQVLEPCISWNCCLHKCFVDQASSLCFL